MIFSFSKALTLSICGMLLNFVSHSQITKGNWMVGGNFSFTSTETGDNQGSNKINKFTVSPNIGYFFIDKLVAGIRPSYSTQKDASSGNNGNGIYDFTSKQSLYGVGPYARYYFLKPENTINLFAEATYLYSTAKNIYPNQTRVSYPVNSYSFAAGPVIFFNSSVGLELMVGYMFQNPASSTLNTKVIFANIGFQIHLEKDN